MTTSNSRTADHAIDTLFLDRWSPRAFTGEAMPQEALATLFEAARWAPSAGNGQPWFFVYGHRGTDAFARIYETLDDGNRRWTDKASVLAVILSRTHRRAANGELRPIYTHAFDTGAAWHALALQATLSGYHAHAMGGIDREAAMAALQVPDGFRVEAGLAIGKIAPRETLPEDLAVRETPSQRKPASEFAFEGFFTGEKP
ncbi:nitroreductase family protein [Rhizobium sp. TRM95111]|uniref:nitroreductase family protein n=1 Tax=Rhizobium alarense TaxID=2846851 RepID=UPI001F373F79|nr:nitroreductase family protein [Rhizobium alarense]MCF3639955.1 nitroreductase family protein [Rhizobium alarense]